MQSTVELRRQVAQAAQDYLEGKVGAVETSRVINALAHRLDASLTHLLIGFNGVDSETDAFPVGKVREMWNPDSLRREDEARRKYEESVSESMREMCKKVVEVFGAAPPNSALQRTVPP